MAKGTKRKKEPRMIPGTSDYVVRENAARKQLGVAGLAARNKQLPAAARATARGLVREITGVDISRKGISVDPASLAMALPLGKVIKAARVLRAAGQAGKAEAVMSRAAAKLKGQKIGREFSYFDEPVEIARETRARSESVFPRVTELEKRLNLPGTAPKTTVTRGVGTVNPEGYAALQKKPDFLGKGAFNVPIVDTRRMNPAQAKSALEKGVNQTATYKRGVPSTPKKVNKVTKRLLGGR